jgi:hypothetical protein
MSPDREQGRSQEEWNEIDRGGTGRDRGRPDLDLPHADLPDLDLVEKADDTSEATAEGAGSEPPD